MKCSYRDKDDIFGNKREKHVELPYLTWSNDIWILSYWIIDVSDFAVCSCQGNSYGHEYQVRLTTEISI
jgi:hypothetical protein